MLATDSEMIRLLEKLNEYLSGKEINAWLIGGFVRDMLLERPVADIDIAVRADAQEVAEEVADLLGGTYVPLDEENNIARVVLPENDNIRHMIDFSAYEKSIRRDLERRDFTIDAMAIKLQDAVDGPEQAEITDPYHGREDIRNRLIQAVKPSVFVLDPIRLLRGVRLAYELGFSFEPDTEDLMREHGHMIFEVPGERVREELMRLMALPGAGKILERLDDLDLLTAIFPYLEETRGVEQPKEHHWDVLEHSLATVQALDFILGEGEWPYVEEDILRFVPISDTIRKHLQTGVSGGSTRKSLLRLAALLHDLGKPLAKTFDETGRMRFFGHGPKGAEFVVKMLERLRFSGKEIKIIETEVVHHMRPTQICQEGEMPTDRAIYRYFRDTGSTGMDIFFLNLADHLATRGPDLNMDGWKYHTSLIEYILRKKNEKENLVNPTKIVDGYDIMSYFGLQAGPEIGKILEELREAQASGEVKDREDALSFVRKIVQSGDFPSQGKEIK